MRKQDLRMSRVGVFAGLASLSLVVVTGLITFIMSLKTNTPYPAREDDPTQYREYFQVFFIAGFVVLGQLLSSVFQPISKYISSRNIVASYTANPGLPFDVLSTTSGTLSSGSDASLSFFDYITVIFGGMFTFGMLVRVILISVVEPFTGLMSMFCALAAPIFLGPLVRKDSLGWRSVIGTVLLCSMQFLTLIVAVLMTSNPFSPVPSGSPGGFVTGHMYIFFVGGISITLETQLLRKGGKITPCTLNGWKGLIGLFAIFPTVLYNHSQDYFWESVWGNVYDLKLGIEETLSSPSIVITAALIVVFSAIFFTFFAGFCRATCDVAAGTLVASVLTFAVLLVFAATGDFIGGTFTIFITVGPTAIIAAIALALSKKDHKKHDYHQDSAENEVALVSDAPIAI